MVMIFPVHEEKGSGVENREHRDSLHKYCSLQTLHFVVKGPPFIAMSFLALNCARTIVTLACKFNMFWCEWYKTNENLFCACISNHNKSVQEPPNNAEVCVAFLISCLRFYGSSWMEVYHPAWQCLCNKHRDLFIELQCLETSVWITKHKIYKCLLMPFKNAQMIIIDCLFNIIYV